MKPIAGVTHGLVIEKALADVGAHVSLQVGHFFAAGAIVAQTDLIATVPWGLGQALGRLIGLRAFTPPIELPTPHLSITWHERHHRDPGNAWLRETFIRQMRPIYAEASR